MVFLFNRDTFKNSISKAFLHLAAWSEHYVQPLYVVLGELIRRSGSLAFERETERAYLAQCNTSAFQQEIYERVEYITEEALHQSFGSHGAFE